MAARNRPGLAENTRKRIQATMIVKRLMNHIDGKCEMTATQVRAAEILLNKVLPNLRHTEHTGMIEQHVKSYSDLELAHGIIAAITGGEEAGDRGITANAQEIMDAITGATDSSAKH